MTESRPAFAHAANRELLERLREDAIPASGPARAFVVDGWTLRTHPDLEEALFALARQDAGHAYGVAVLAESGRVVYAVGLGTSGIAFRGTEGEPHPRFGPGWIRVSAWKTDIEELRRRARSARDAAANEA